LIWIRSFLMKKQGGSRFATIAFCVTSALVGARPGSVSDDLVRFVAAPGFAGPVDRFVGGPLTAGGLKSIEIRKSAYCSNLL
jgi:hypothetical protein